MKLHKFTKAKLDYYRSSSNFTDDELAVFDLLSKGRTVKEISLKLSVSTRTVDRRIADIKFKIANLP